MQGRETGHKRNRSQETESADLPASRRRRLNEQLDSQSSENESEYEEDSDIDDEELDVAEAILQEQSITALRNHLRNGMALRAYERTHRNYPSIFHCFYRCFDTNKIFDILLRHAIDNFPAMLPDIAQALRLEGLAEELANDLNPAIQSALNIMAERLSVIAQPAGASSARSSEVSTLPVASAAAGSFVMAYIPSDEPCSIEKPAP